MKRITFFLLFSAVIHCITYAEIYPKRQDWQWYTSISTVDNKGSVYNLTPYLWIPPTCQKVNAVFVASTAVLEQILVEDPDIRAVCAKRGIAILWSSDNFYHDDVTASGQIQTMLNVFSSLTGYTELKSAPWIVTGHSGTNPMPRYIIKNTPANIAFGIINKATAQCGNGTTVPVLSTNGEFMEWDSYSKDLTANITTESSYGDVRNQRNTYGQPLSYFFDPNTGHFDCSKPLTRNIAMWMDDIFALRFDSHGNMIAIDQTKGWITGLPCAGYTADKFAPIPYTNQATGNLTLAQVKAAAWYPSQRTAQAAYDMANVSMTRTTQVTGFADAAGLYDAQAYWWRAIMYKIPFTLNADGHSVTLNTVPYYRMPNRTDYQDNAYTPNQSFFNKADNSFTNSGNPSQIEICSGNWKQTGANSFEYIPRFKSTNYFIVRQQGDATYRSSVQAGNVNLTAVSGGTANTITFNAIPNQSYASLSPLTLAATSTAGITVRYFVNSGPAHVSGNQLIFDKDSIPPRAHFPIPVTVTAYHMGTASPLVNTATSVSRTFYIMNGALTPLTWFVAPTASGTGDGTSWSNACTIQAAINYATYGDNIFMKSGDYSLSTSLSIDSKVVNIYGGFAGTETNPAERIKADLDQNGITESWEMKYPTRFVGGRYKATPASFTVLKVTGATASDVRIDGISVEEGLYLGGGNPAGIRIDGKCTLANSIVRNCRAYNAAGDLNSNAPGGVCTTVTDAVIDGCLIENCEVQPCQSTATYGAQAKGGGVWSTGTIQNSVVRNNRILYNLIQPSSNTNTIKYNPYLYAAGIYLYNKTAKAINCLINNNEIRVVNWDMVNHLADLSSITVRGAGINAENGGSIIHCTVVNNAVSVRDLSGNAVLTAANAGQGVGIYHKTSNSASTNNEGYLVNTVAWGNYSPGVSAGSQQIYLSTATSASASAPLFVYNNNITSATVSGFISTNTAFFSGSGQLTDLAGTNGDVAKSPKFFNPSTFSGAVWSKAADSLAIVSKSNWTPQTGSYLLSKGTPVYATVVNATTSAPSTDLNAGLRDGVHPTVGAFEALAWNDPTGTNIPVMKPSKAYRVGNRIYNVEEGDRIILYDALGRKLEQINVTQSPVSHQQKGFVIITVETKSGLRYSIK